MGFSDVIFYEHVDINNKTHNVVCPKHVKATNRKSISRECDIGQYCCKPALYHSLVRFTYALIDSRRFSNRLGRKPLTKH